MASVDDFYGKDLAFKTDFVLTATGDIDTLTGLDNLKDALYRRLLTHPGSLVHRPDYGVGIKYFQNAVNSLSKKRDLAIKIKEQFERDPRVKEVKGVSVNSKSDLEPDTVIVSVSVESVGYGELKASFILFGDA
jgi:phage baseplate assembly protein W